jgi:hypothetical protein
MVGGITIAERGGEINAFGCDVLLITVLAVEADDVDGPEVAGVVLLGGCIFDVVKGELVFTGGGDGCARVGASALEALVTVTVGVFLGTERLDTVRVEALDHRFQQDRFDVLLGEKLSERGERYRFGLVDANREPHVDCGVHGAPLGWTPGVTPSSRESVATEL